PRFKESRLVVFGNSNFATDSLFEQQLNGDVFLNTVSWLSQQEEKLMSIRPKEPKNRRIIISNLEANLLTISAVVLLPLLGLLTGFIIWWKRR
ncbi:MAG: ABC transporter, partial [Dolichospermum sp.]